jgi:hypothetical protein
VRPNFSQSLDFLWFRVFGWNFCVPHVIVVVLEREKLGSHPPKMTAVSSGFGPAGFCCLMTNSTSQSTSLWI